MTGYPDNDIPFFKLLFDEGVYKIRKNKYATGDTIVPIKSVNEESASYIPKTIRFTGITSKTLLLFNYPDEDAIPLEDNLFLGQVLKAAGLDFEKLLRLYIGGLNKNITLADIAAQSGSDFVIAFGIDKACLPDGIGEGRVYNINNKRVLCSSSLSELSTDTSKKKLLWQGLKEIYGL